MDQAPRSHQLIKDSIKKGLIIVHTGAGKGKSTAAFGTALRAVGSGFKVAVVQFIKGNWKTGEAEAAKKHFGDKLQFYSMGKGFTWETKDFEQDVQRAKEAWKKCLEVLQDKEHELVIFDEINYCVIGRRKKNKITLGDQVKVKVIGTDIDRRTIDLAFI